MRLETAQAEIDGREDELEAAVSLPAPSTPGNVRTDRAFEMWRGTALERYRVSSAIELYNRSELLVSRFALNLPEESSAQSWREEGCTWRTFGEISPFGSHERQLLHAGRNVCGPGGVLGTIVIHVILDNSTLSFISSQNPYLELLRSVARGGGRSEPRRRVRLLRVEPQCPVRLGQRRLAHRRFALRADQQLPSVVLDDAPRRQRVVPRVRGKRPVRHLRAGLPRHPADGALHQPGGVDRAHGPRLHRAAPWRGPGPCSRSTADSLRPGASPGDPRELLPKALPRLCRGVGDPRGDARPGHAGVHRGAAEERRGSRPRTRRR